MKFRAISSDQINQLAERAKQGDEEASALLRVFGTCRDTECVSCATEFTRRNRVAGWIIAFASDEPGAEFGIRMICQRCVRAAGSLEAAVSAIVAPTQGTA